MSLTQHVSATEGTDRQPLLADPEDFKPIRQVLSYDAFPPPEEEQNDHLAAYKISAFKRAGKNFDSSCGHLTNIMQRKF